MTTAIFDPIEEPPPDDYPWAPTGIYFGESPVSGISPYTGEIVTIHNGEQLTPGGVINNAEAQVGANILTDIMTQIAQSRPQMNAIDRYNMAYTTQVNGARILNGTMSIAEAINSIVSIAQNAPDHPIWEPLPVASPEITAVTVLPRLLPPNTGTGGLLGAPINIFVGPGGRTWLQIKAAGTYVDDPILWWLERDWFLNKTGLTIGMYDAYGIPIVNPTPLATAIPLVGPGGRTFWEIQAAGRNFSNDFERDWYNNIQSYLNGVVPGSSPPVPPVAVTASQINTVIPPTPPPVTPAYSGNQAIAAGNYTYSNIGTLVDAAIRAGFRDQTITLPSGAVVNVLQVMVAIAMAESSGTGIQGTTGFGAVSGVNPNGTQDYGAWQNNFPAGSFAPGSQARVFDPYYSAQLAFANFSSRLNYYPNSSLANQYNTAFQAWSVFTSSINSYRTYMDVAGQAVQATRGQH